MPAPSLGSMLLSSTDPERLAGWYAATLEPKSDTRMEPYRILEFGQFYLMIDTRGDVGSQNPEPARMILNFDVPDAQAVAARFEAQGSQWVAPLEDRDGNWFGTVQDPDGNYVQIIQLSEETLAAMRDQSR